MSQQFQIDVEYLASKIAALAVEGAALTAEIKALRALSANKDKVIADLQKQIDDLRAAK